MHADENRRSLLYRQRTVSDKRTSAGHGACEPAADRQARPSDVVSV
jgi:hypothetical protein